MSILDSYNKLVKPTTSLPNESFDTHIPTPSKLDYTRGYISRYFIKKVNDVNSPIFEIDSKTGHQIYYKANLNQNLSLNLFNFKVYF
jgi:hypothetical protein